MACVRTRDSRRFPCGDRCGVPISGRMASVPRLPCCCTDEHTCPCARGLTIDPEARRPASVMPRDNSSSRCCSLFRLFGNVHTTPSRPEAVDPSVGAGRGRAKGGRAPQQCASFPILLSGPVAGFPNSLRPCDVSLRCLSDPGEQQAVGGPGCFPGAMLVGVIHCDTTSQQAAFK